MSSTTSSSGSGSSVGSTVDGDDEDPQHEEDSVSLLEVHPNNTSTEFELASLPTVGTNTPITASPNKTKLASSRQQQQQPQASAYNDNFDSSYQFSSRELTGLTEDNINDLQGSSMKMNLAAGGGGGGSGGKQVLLLPNNHMPFVGRDNELTILDKAVERISLEWMENPSEVVWISGKRGVGKSTLVQHASEKGNSSAGGFRKSFVCRGTCEQYHTATHPFQALTDALNDLCWQLMQSSSNNKTSSSIWKTRLEEALGGEGPLVATICPVLCQILDIAPMDRRPLFTTFDANTPQRLDRLAFAVRDLLLAVCEHHPIIFIMDQIHYADPDTLALLEELLSTKPLQNFLLIGILDSSVLALEDHPLTVMKELLSNDTATRTTDIRLQGLTNDQVHQVMTQVLMEDSTTDDPSEDLAELAELVFVLTKGNPLWMVQLLRLWNDQKLITATPITSASLLVKNKKKSNSASSSSSSPKWKWSRKKIKKEVKRWRDEGLECSKSMEGVMQARLEALPKKIQYVVMVLGKLKLTSIRLFDETAPIMINKTNNASTAATAAAVSSSSSSFSIPSNFYRVFVAASFHKKNKNDVKEKDPITSQAELEKMVLKACAWGILKKLHRPGSYKFSNDVMRECAATLTSPYDKKDGNKKSGVGGGGGGGGNPLKIQLYMGTELSTLSMEAATKAAAAAGVGGGGAAAAGVPPMSPKPRVSAATAAGVGGLPQPPMSPNPGGAGGPGPRGAPSAAVMAAAQQRERYKFLAVEQLYTVHGAMDDTEKGKLAKINLEAAEIAISKTAFRTAIVYLERGIAAVDHTLRWEPRYYDVTFRTFLFLARMRLCCGRNSAAKAACDEIFENCGTIKDRVYATQVLVILLQREGKYDKALEKLLDVLKRLGEVFPPGGDEVKHILEREINSLRKGVEKIPNQQLLNPKKMTDKKAVDTMMMLAFLVDISRHASAKHYKDFAMIRMMHMCLKMGFTRQYPLAFSLFAVALVERGFIKEAHRMGQIAEKIARVGDFYGGESVVLFHWKVSHWRRTYKRNLQPVLRIYNAQVDAGDFSHVGFSISTYIQYHLASGFDIEKLSDNIQLFQGLYLDYHLADKWLIDISQQAVSNLMGETATPLIFFGVTMAQQDAKIEEYRKARIPKAIDYLHLLRLFVAFFFHNFEVMQECFERVQSSPPEGVWIVWMAFMECFMLIQRLPGSKGKERKELKERIEHLKDMMIDWYNDGAPNPNAMISILEAEWTIAKEAGKGLSAMKAQELWNEAVEAAVKSGNTNLEAFACERAAMHFLRTGVEGFCADYMIRSHKVYDQCQYIAKVIDLETSHGDLLNITQKRARPASAYNQMNASLKPSDKQIGGGQQDIKTVNVTKGFKNAAQALRKGGGVKSTSRKVKELFKKEKAAPAPWGWGSKNQLALDEEGAANAEDPMSPSPTSKPRSSRLFGGLAGKKKKNKEGGNDEDEGGNEDNTGHPSSGTTSPTSPPKSPTKSPRRPMSRLFRKAAKPPLNEDAADDSDEERPGEEDINDMLESPRPKGSRTLNTNNRPNQPPMDLPFEESSSDEEEDDDADEGEPKKKKKDKKKKSKKDKKKK